MGIPLVSGRGLTERDHQKAPEVAVINEAAARKFFPNENPIGRRFGHRPEGSGNIEIVGVVRDVRYNNLRQPPPPTLYQPHLQSNPEDLVFSIRTASDPGNVMSAARAAVSAADLNIPVLRVETQMSTLEQRYRTGESPRAGVHAFWQHRIVRRRDRTVRPVVVQRLSPHARNRHPDGDGRRKPRGTRPAYCANRCCSSRSAS